MRRVRLKAHLYSDWHQIIERVHIRYTPPAYDRSQLAFVSGKEVEGSVPNTSHPKPQKAAPTNSPMFAANVKYEGVKPNSATTGVRIRPVSS